MEENTGDQAIYKYKVILIGDSSVGKTSLIIRFCDDKFEGNAIATLGIDTRTKYVIRKDKKIELQIWDTAGQEKFKSLSKSCCNQMDGIVFVYDMGKNISFKNIRDWYVNLKDVVDYNTVGLALVGNKCDIEQKEVDTSRGEEFASKHNMTFVEASAKNNINVNEIFTNLVDSLIKLDSESNCRRAKSKAGKIDSSFTIDEEDKNKKKKKMCC